MIEIVYMEEYFLTFPSMMVIEIHNGSFVILYRVK